MARTVIIRQILEKKIKVTDRQASTDEDAVKFIEKKFKRDNIQFDPLDDTPFVEIKCGDAKIKEEIQLEGYDENED